MGPGTVRPTPTTTPADEAKTTAHDIHSTIPANEATAIAPSIYSTTPEGWGKTKIQFCIDRKVALLEERLHVYEVLDQHLKEENVMLKERVTKLDQQLEDTKSQKIFLSKRVWKWYDEFQKDQGKISVLKAKMAKARLGSPGDLNIQASPSDWTMFLLHFWIFTELLPEDKQPLGPGEILGIQFTQFWAFTQHNSYAYFT